MPADTSDAKRSASHGAESRSDVGRAAEDARALWRIKTVHTAAWAFFVVCIAGTYGFALLGAHGLAAVCALIVLGEVLVLAAHGWACPLTAIAARHTDDRRPNFDIWLPVWLARYNKHIFGPLYVVGVLFAAWRWAVAG